MIFCFLLDLVLMYALSCCLREDLRSLLQLPPSLAGGGHCDARKLLAQIEMEFSAELQAKAIALTSESVDEEKGLGSAAEVRGQSKKKKRKKTKKVQTLNLSDSVVVEVESCSSQSIDEAGVDPSAQYLPPSAASNVKAYAAVAQLGSRACGSVSFSCGATSEVEPSRMSSDQPLEVLIDGISALSIKNKEPRYHPLVEATLKLRLASEAPTSSVLAPPCKCS